MAERDATRGRLPASFTFVVKAWVSIYVWICRNLIHHSRTIISFSLSCVLFIVTFIQDAANQYDGIVINPGGYSHTSVSILDALKIYKGAKVEVHLSKLTSRKDLYRQKMITAEGVDILLEGLLDLSYFIGVFSIYSRLKPKG